MTFEKGINYDGQRVSIGDSVKLENQTQEVVTCEETSVPMLNIDADQLAIGDLAFIKRLGLTISNPNTERPVALGVDFEPETFGEKVSNYFSGSDDDDDDSSFFNHSSPSVSSPSESSSFGFGGGSSFGGFGGGGFSGGGASGSF